MGLSGVTSMAARGVLAELAAAHADQGGTIVAFTAMGGVEAARRVREGLAVDLVALAAGVIDALAAEGRLLAGARVDYARSGIAAAVPAGATPPPIETEAGLRAALLAAPRVAYSTGPSGDHLTALWRRWGLDMAGRAVQAPPGVPVASLLARGEAELGFQQLSELMGAPGITLLAPLPASAQLVTVFACAATAGCAAQDAARAFLRFLASPAAAAAIRRAGMEPG